MRTEFVKTLRVEALRLAVCIALAGFVSILRKQDASWDLQNYHFYNAWAFVHGRITWDIAPAQLQTYFNPIADLPFYFMVAAGWPPQLIAFVLAIPAGIAAWLLVKLLFLLFCDLPWPQRVICVSVAWAIGMTASHALGMLGTTSNDWVGVPLFIAALWVLMRAIAGEEMGSSSLVVAGILTGLASALKLSSAPMAVGLAVSLFLRPRRLRRRFLETFVFCSGVVVGFALAGGYWMTILWSNFDSPVFPFFNNWIHSPWWIDHPGSFRVYGPHKFAEWLVFPFREFRTEASYLGENFFRDWRFPLAYLLGLAMIGRWAWNRWHLQSKRLPSAVSSVAAEYWKLVTIFWIVSFLLWAAQHSIQRYIVVLEILSGALIVGAVRAMVPGRHLTRSAVAFAVAAIVTTVSPNFGRIDFRSRWFDVRIPPVESKALVLLISDAPMSFVLPYFPADARFVGIDNQLNDNRFVPWLFKTKTYQRMQQIVGAHDGPIYSLTYPKGRGSEALAPYRVRRLEDSCQGISTNMSTSPLELCRLERLPGG